jgi:hypothetical protein
VPPANKKTNSKSKTSTAHSTKKPVSGALSKVFQKLSSSENLTEPLVSAPPEMSASHVSRSWSIYSAADKCPLDAFLKCQEGSDLSPLIISGNPPIIDLQAAFLRIYSQFCTVSEDTEAYHHFLFLAQIAALSSRIEAVQLLTAAWEREPSAAIAEALELWGFSLPGADASPEERRRDVAMVRSRIKRDVLDLKMLEAEREKQSKDQKGSAGRDSGGLKMPGLLFDKVMISLSDTAGYNLRGDEMTVQQYAIRVAAARKKPAKNKPQDT